MVSGFVADFILIAKIGFVASIPIYLLYIFASSLSNFATNSKNVEIEYFYSHLKAVVILSIFTIIYWLNFIIFDNKHGQTIIQLFFILIIFKIIIFFFLASSQKKWNLIKLYFFLFIWCLLAAAVYGLGNIPDNSHFMPAMDNNDLFMYLLRGSSLLKSDRNSLASEISFVSTSDFITISSKFASSFLLYVFLRLTDNLGVAAAACMVAIRVCLAHVLFFLCSPYQTATVSQYKYQRWLNLLILLLAPVPILLSFLFHLSQLLFIYLASLQIVFIWRSNWLKLKSFILLNTVLVIYLCLVYPVALPLYAVENILIAVAWLYYYPQQQNKLVSKKLIINAVSLLIVFLAFWQLFTNSTDLNTHLSGDYHRTGYFFIVAHWILPLSEYMNHWRWQNASLLLQQAIGIVIDSCFFWSVIYLIGKKLVKNYKNKYQFLGVIVFFNWSLFQIAFQATDGNYRALKFNTTFIAIPLLFLTAYLLNQLLINKSFKITLIIYLVLITNLIDIHYLSFNRSVSKNFDFWIDSINNSSIEHIVYDFKAHNTNMYLPLVLKNKKLYPLDNSYFPTKDIQRICNSIESEEARVFFTPELSNNKSKINDEAKIIEKSLNCKSE